MRSGITFAPLEYGYYSPSSVFSLTRFSFAPEVFAEERQADTLHS